jgi:hypothetical protein
MDELKEVFAHLICYSFEDYAFLSIGSLPLDALIIALFHSTHSNIRSFFQMIEKKYLFVEN